MKLELIKKGKKYFIKTGEHKEEIMRDSNEDDIAYLNKCFAIFDRKVNQYRDFFVQMNEEVIKSVNI